MNKQTITAAVIAAKSNRLFHAGVALGDREGREFAGSVLVEASMMADRLLEKGMPKHARETLREGIAAARSELGK